MCVLVAGHLMAFAMSRILLCVKCAPTLHSGASFYAVPPTPGPLQWASLGLPLGPSASPDFTMCGLLDLWTTPCWSQLHVAAPAAVSSCDCCSPSFWVCWRANSLWVEGRSQACRLFLDSVRTAFSWPCPGDTAFCDKNAVAAFGTDRKGLAKQPVTTDSYFWHLVESFLRSFLLLQALAFCRILSFAVPMSSKSQRLNPSIRVTRRCLAGAPLLCVLAVAVPFAAASRPSGSDFWYELAIFDRDLQILESLHPATQQSDL